MLQFGKRSWTHGPLLQQVRKHTRHCSSFKTFLCRCDEAGVESKTLALWKSKEFEPLKDAADYAAAVMESEYDNSYGWS